MKKTHALILIIIFIILLTNPAFAESNFLVKTNGQTLPVRKVDMDINSITPEMEAPAFILGDRTLVPIRFIAEGVGAKVDWIAESKTVIVTYQGKMVSMSIDSDKVHVGQEIQTLDSNSIPRLITFPKLSSYPNADTRTMVPARFISEVLGFDVGWDPKTYTVSIKTDNETPKEETPESDAKYPEKLIIETIDFKEGPREDVLRISGTDRIKYRSTYIEKTNKIVIDIEDARLDIGRDRDTPGNIMINNNIVEKVQYSQFTLNPFTTRIVVTLFEEADYDFDTSGNKKELVISIENRKEVEEEDEVHEEEQESDKVEEDEESKEPELSPNSSLVTKIAIREDRDNNEYVFFEGLKNPEYTTFKLTNPKRLVVDVKDAVFAEPKSKQYPVTLGNSSNIRVGQFARKGVVGETEDVMRIVFDIENERDPYPNLVFVDDGDDSYIIEDTNSWGNFSYKYDRERFGMTIELDNLKEDRFDFTYNPNNKLLMIEMPSESSNIPIGVNDFYDGYLKSVEVRKSNDKTTILIEFTRDVEVDDKSDDDYIAFDIEPRDMGSSGAKTIVIDPGHGGKDPGARSPQGRLEKEHNITVSLKLRDALELAGYNVVLTRDTDRWIELLDRPAIANNINADLFISVHANANPKPEIRGLEVIYCPAYDCAVKTGDQYPFAKAIYDNIVALTGRDFGRGIVKGSKYVVVNRTNMPAIILETGYLTNAEENPLLWTNEFQSKIVTGVVNGVNEYFEYNN